MSRVRQSALLDLSQREPQQTAITGRCDEYDGHSSSVVRFITQRNRIAGNVAGKSDWPLSGHALELMGFVIGSVN